MDVSGLQQFEAALLSLALCFAMIAAARFGVLRARRSPDSKESGAIETALLGLLGLLLAFTYSGAVSRFETRGRLMVDAANAMRAAVQHADFYPSETRTALRRDLAEYLQAQIEFYRSEHDDSELRIAATKISTIQHQLWSRVVTAAREPSNALATDEMSRALDAMFSLAASRDVAAQSRMPGIVLLLLFIVAAATAYASGRGSPAVQSGSSTYVMFAVLTALVVYVTLDLDQPGRGIIRRDVQERAIEAVGTLLQD